MAKIDGVQEVSLDLLRPYENNAKVHTEKQINKIAESIKAFGFLNPCIIDNEFNIIAGHGRVLAAHKLGLASVPCVFAEGLTEAERKAYILADNKLTELGEWDQNMLTGEIEDLLDMDFDVELTGFDFDVDNADWFEDRQRYDNDLSNETQEYKDFVEKFEEKRTTDDCYTPDLVYDAVANWVAKRYNLNREKFVRPFYPGGDYQAEVYPPGSIVVDNPPFSIMSEIIRFYTEKGIRFFLFAPGLAGMGGAQIENATLICAGAQVTYENGASISTDFSTNLEGDVVAMTCPELRRLVDAASDAARKENRVELPKYTYPSSIVTQPMLNDWSRLGIEFSLKRGECVRVSGLDAQKPEGKAIYGGGLLLAEKARIEAEKARIEAEKAKPRIEWELSERERALIAEMG